MNDPQFMCPCYEEIANGSIAIRSTALIGGLKKDTHTGSKFFFVLPTVDEENARTRCVKA